MRWNEISQTLYFEANALEHVQTQRFPVCLHRRFGSIHRLTHKQSWTQGGYGEPGPLQQQLQQIGTLCLSLPCVPTLSHNVRELRQTQLTGIWIRSVRIFVLWLDYYGVYWLKQSWANSIYNNWTMRAGKLRLRSLWLLLLQFLVWKSSAVSLNRNCFAFGALRRN